MAHTYTKIYIQVVIVVKYRAGLIDKSWKDDLFKYITGIVKKQNHLVISINGVEDHVHLLIGLRPHQSLSDLMRHVKGFSSKWINEQNLTQHPFNWQLGFGAFSYAPDALPNVIRYIENQEVHHSKKKFLDEYKELLKQYDVEYDEKYLFYDV
jgi:putative transposase